MLHQMNLNTKPFEMICSGLKTIELRLNDEKRQAIEIGDEIEFSNNSDGRKLIVKVRTIYKFPNFDELYHKLPLDKCGYQKDKLSQAKAEDMEAYYSKEKQERYGVLGIEIELFR